MDRITKRFQNVIANDGVSIALRYGEVRAILGENGAGKSSLMKVLGGLYRPDAGQIYLEGRSVRITSPRVAYQLGIGMVHQHYMLVQNLTVVENVVLGVRSNGLRWLDLKTAGRRLNQLADEYEFDVDPNAMVDQLSVGAQQRVELLKALFRDVKVIALDEPTAVLGPAEVKQLFRIIRQLASKGIGVVFISHKLEEVKAVSQTVTVLRNGRVVGEAATAQISQPQLARLMIGREPSQQSVSPRSTSGPPVLLLKAVDSQADRGTAALHNVSLVVGRGEIVGIAGVEGNGQRELAECIAGLRAVTAGHITIAGVAVDRVVCDPLILGFIPQDRQQTGLILDFTVAENLVLKPAMLASFARRGLIRWGAVAVHAKNVLNSFDIRHNSVNTPARHLSGGNQQRIVLARETSGEPTLIVAEQPTRGLDIAAIESVHRLFRNLRARGTAVLYISSDLDDLLSICDRLIVLSRGEVVGELPADASLSWRIGEMMMGNGSEGVH
jgi:simple sugar transport system ATP-binding protein